jgi:23S rRNA (cytosine1962-C5)-methyltransferase
MKRTAAAVMVISLFTLTSSGVGYTSPNIAHPGRKTGRESPFFPCRGFAVIDECVVVVKKNRERPILEGHPWVFSGAVKEYVRCSGAGEVCSVLDEGGRFIARGYVNRRSAIPVRVLTTRDVPIDGTFIRRALANALETRSRVMKPLPDACRIVNAEGDFLPGLIVDRYGDGLVVQILTAGMQNLRGLIVDALVELTSPGFIYEKSKSAASAREGFDFTDGPVLGETPARVVVGECGAQLAVDIPGGQKTGLYLDQRENRRLSQAISGGMRVLNCFSYSGAFGVLAVLGGAKSVLNVDSSERALEQARENAALNGLDERRFGTLREDVFTFLRMAHEPWDLVILDPPRFAGAKKEVPGAARGYKDINLCAMKLVRPGGMLMTFSCSSHVDEELFRKIVFGAAVDARRRVQILRALGADVDHPVNLAHREGEYLKGLLLRVG